MPRSKAANSRPVYSTDKGRLCPQCQRAVAGCVCGKDRPTGVGDGVVRIRRETKGRGGKAVTVIEGIPLPPDELKALAKVLKKRCGVGGSTRESNIEIQGDARELVKRELEQRGFTVKLAGG
ncbi:MAG: translation initiation factor Sui1 [Halieaceae bacterium]|nr:translation initiation factor Sui1 [Halieaceae bacterium]